MTTLCIAGIDVAMFLGILFIQFLFSFSEDTVVFLRLLWFDFYSVSRFNHKSIYKQHLSHVSVATVLTMTIKPL